MRTIIVLMLVAGCSDGTPTPTGTLCADPDPNTLTYENFGRQFMTDYCTMCHALPLLRPQRNGAPLYHDFDTLEGVVRVQNHIDEQSGFGPEAENTFMAPDRCPSVPGGPLSVSCRQPTAEERTKLAEWLACEKARPHMF